MDIASKGAGDPCGCSAETGGHVQPLTVLNRSDADELGLRDVSSRARPRGGGGERHVADKYELIGGIASTETMVAAKPIPRSDADGIDGLVDEPRSGRREVDRSKIIALTLTPPPKKLGITHWSSRLLAAHLKTSNSTIAKTWREAGVPWRSKTSRFSNDPQLVAEVTDMFGLYLAPPENAIVLRVDEKSQIQALDRTTPMLPM